MFGMKTLLYVVVLYGSIIVITKCNDLDIEDTKPNVIARVVRRITLADL